MVSTQHIIISPSNVESRAQWFGLPVGRSGSVRPNCQQVVDVRRIEVQFLLILPDGIETISDRS